MARRPLADWFIPGEGIHRDVITSNVQRYLGNDATVRAGDKTIDGKLVGLMHHMACNLLIWT